MGRITVLHADFGGCAGCSVSILRSYPEIKDTVKLETPYLVDKYFQSEGYDVAIITGGICVNEGWMLDKLKYIREISDVVVAYGSCAAFGGILRFCRGGQEPRPDHRSFQPINSVIKVDYSIPGCPPAPLMLQSFFRFYLDEDERRLELFRICGSIKKLSGFDLLDDVVLTGLCIGCGACELSCPTHALQVVDKRPNLVQERCIRCGTCYIRCPRATQILTLGGGSRDQRL
ncbi:NADH-quinone oxidoreductase subunit B family protein [Thermococcus pacificus]|uniref:Coenzyme F420 hydrogenase n=1 Tax=Thermococcus pacificus TaxID=71998 RepID=A0A218P898_9EURY|nr:4Fe-4S binding protein [Thermococcus pacificus]ASJ07015.1 coenzyme F420 hydrogenase [Thermococcus pacificus]